jgi:hypothetical protein
MVEYDALQRIFAGGGCSAFRLFFNTFTGHRHWNHPQQTAGFAAIKRRKLFAGRFWPAPMTRTRTSRYRSNQLSWQITDKTKEMRAPSKV